MQAHFYAVVGWALPEEIADQPAHVLKCNPGGLTWGELLKRTEFADAEALSLNVRNRLLTRFVSACKLELKASCKRPVHTTYNVFRLARLPGATEGEEDGDEERPCSVFYADCAPTHDREGGLLSVQRAAGRGGEPPTVFWFHGPRKVGVPGGGAWDMPQAAHAFPCAGAGLQCNMAFLDTMVKAGYRAAWGYAKLVPIIMLPP